MIRRSAVAVFTNIFYYPCFRITWKFKFNFSFAFFFLKFYFLPLTHTDSLPYQLVEFGWLRCRWKGMGMLTRWACDVGYLQDYPYSYSNGACCSRGDSLHGRVIDVNESGGEGWEGELSCQIHRLNESHHARDLLSPFSKVNYMCHDITTHESPQQVESAAKGQMMSVIRYNRVSKVWINKEENCGNSKVNGFLKTILNFMCHSSSSTTRPPKRKWRWRTIIWTCTCYGLQL